MPLPVTQRRPRRRMFNMTSGRFEAGRSGNPNGRPKGARNKATIVVESLLEGEAEALTRRAIELA